VVCANYTRLLTKDTMSDVYKRPRPGGDGSEMMTRMAIPTSTLGSADYEMPPEINMASASAAPRTPARTSEITPDPHAEELILPSGVRSFDHWGKTKIVFGKYKTFGWSYHTMATNYSTEVQNYRSWVVNHEKTGGSQLKDLAKYLRAAEKRDLFPRITTAVSAAEGVMSQLLEPSSEQP
jgi:hypothetical protein